MAQLDLKLDRDSDIPLGTQLAWKLRGAIAAGTLRAGDRLPGVRELAGEAGVNVNTVRAVYARLAEQGVTVSEQGRGTFVSNAASGSDLAALVERAAGEARRHGVDPRELAAVLYARFDATVATVEARPVDGERRGALRAEIEALERELAELEPLSGAMTSAHSRAGARLVTTEELEGTRDKLAARVAEVRRQRRLARRTAPQPVPPATRSSWPELMALAPSPS